MRFRHSTVGRALNLVSVISAAATLGASTEFHSIGPIALRAPGDSCVLKPAKSDSVTETLVLALRMSGYGKGGVLASTIQSVAESTAARLPKPPPDLLERAVYPLRTRKPSDKRFQKWVVSIPGIDGTITLVRGRDTHVSDAPPERHPLDSLVRSAIRSAISQSAGLLHDRSGKDSLELEFQIDLVTTSTQDFVAPWISAQLPLFAERRVEQSSIAREISSLVPLDLYGLTGTVRVQYVVNLDGRVDTATVKVLDQSSPGRFGLLAKYELLRYRYRPASVGGCPYRQLVQQAIIFRPDSLK